MSHEQFSSYCKIRVLEFWGFFNANMESAVDALYVTMAFSSHYGENKRPMMMMCYTAKLMG